MMDTENTGFDRIADKFVELFTIDGDKVAKAAILAYLEGVERGKSLATPPAA